MSDGLYCGAAKSVITPKIGTILYGYAPGRPALSVGDDLEAVAIYLKSNEESALLITCSLCAMGHTVSDELRKIAGEASGVNPENVTVCCTHTHSGPNTNAKSGWGEIDYEYIETVLKPKIREVAENAAKNPKKAVMGVGEIETDIGVNRRQIKEDGKIILGQNPWGIRDPRMTVISFKDEDGNIIANMIHYGCHGTAGGKTDEITRDWAGVMTDMLEAETGAITGFYNGFEGDQGPRLPNGRTTGNYALVKQLGGKAGIEAVRAWKTIKQWRDVPLKVLHGVVRVPFKPLASKEEAERKLASLGTLEEIYESKKYANVNAYLHWSNVIAEHKACEEGKTFKTHFEFKQNITTIGQVAIVPAPFEPFAEIGLRIREHSPYAYTLNLCKTHGSYSYFPTKNDIPSGGYEIENFLLAFHTTYQLPENTDDFWVTENLRILRGVDN